MNLFAKRTDSEHSTSFNFSKMQKYLSDVKTLALKNKKKTIIILSGLLAVILAIVLCINIFSDGAKTEIITGIAIRGNLSNAIEGSGTLEANDQYELLAIVKGDILADYIEEGQEVKEGDLLYEIDPTDINNTIEKAKGNVEKSKLSYNQSLESVNNLTVKSPASGIITNMYIKNGDSINNGTKICDIVNFEKMLLVINFNSNDAQYIKKGDQATVYLTNSFISSVGTVTNVGTGALINTEGVSVTRVEILVNNPGGIVPGDSATAIIGEYACNSEGTFSYSEEETVVAKTGGDVYSLNFNAGDKVNKNDVICRLDNDSVLVNEQQSRLSLKDSQLSLDNYYDQLDNYNITSPISGTVIQKNSKAGDTLDNTNSNTTMAIIADLSSLKFTISIDELDITKISVGQQVNITADAMEGKVYTGFVSNVSIVGSSSNGVTSYPVEVTLDMKGIDGLIPGMNVNASIVIESKTDVLMVPVAAVNRGNVVLVKGKSSSSDSENNDVVSSGEERFKGRETSREMPDFSARSDAKISSDGISPRLKDSAKDKINNSSAKEFDRKINSSGENAKENNTKTNTKQNSNDKIQMPRGIEVPDGYRLVRVETGISNGSFVEIVSGDIKEGDTVILTNTSTATSASSNQGMGFGGNRSMPMGNMPMGGGIPMGGGMRR